MAHAFLTWPLALHDLEQLDGLLAVEGVLHVRLPELGLDAAEALHADLEDDDDVVQSYIISFQSSVQLS